MASSQVRWLNAAQMSARREERTQTSPAQPSASAVSGGGRACGQQWPEEERRLQAGKGGKPTRTASRSTQRLCTKLRRTARWKADKTSLYSVRRNARRL